MCLRIKLTVGRLEWCSTWNVRDRWININPKVDSFASKLLLIRICMNKRCRQDFELRLNDDPIRRRRRDRQMIAIHRLSHPMTNRLIRRLVYSTTAS